MAKGMSPHCKVEGPHGLHWAPCAIWRGGFVFQDMCTGTPGAWVTKAGKRYAITDVEVVEGIDMVRFRYVEHGHLDFAAPSEVTVQVSV